MRKIEAQLIEAIKSGKAWTCDNTSTEPTSQLVLVYLWGNHIATVERDTLRVVVNESTLARFPTRTTKSRLQALRAAFPQPQLETAQ